MKKSVLFFFCLFLMSCSCSDKSAVAQSFDAFENKNQRIESVVIDSEDVFIHDIIYQTMYGSSKGIDIIDKKIESMSNDELITFKKKLYAIFQQDKPMITSIAQTWMIYSFIYKIDDMLGVLEYTKIVDGIFKWDRAVTMLGTTDLDFISDYGEEFPIFTTIATIDKMSAYISSNGRRIRLYIKEEALCGGKNRNQVVKIEPLY